MFTDVFPQYQHNGSFYYYFIALNLFIYLVITTLIFSIFLNYLIIMTSLPKFLNSLAIINIKVNF